MRVLTQRLRRVTGPASRPALWLTLTDDQGRTGFGEAAPLAPFSRDTLEGDERALTRIVARLGLIDEHAPPEGAIGRALAPLEPDLARVPAARFAVETALLDLLAQRAGLSIAELLGGPRPYREVIVSGLLVASPDPEGLPERALALAAAGATVIKIKLRAATDEEFAREVRALQATRARLPLPFELRLDPNASFSLASAPARLAALATIAPRFIEQPVAADELHLLGPVAVPWAADESLADLDRDVDRVAILLASAGCAAVILKPPVLGGLLPARSLAARAQACGVEVVVTHFFDGPIGMAAAAELALSLPRAPLACGLDPHAGLSAFPPVVIPQLARRFYLAPSGRAGIGLEFSSGPLR
jgi:o-succinylbenzoate synthase